MFGWRRESLNFVGSNFQDQMHTGSFSHQSSQIKPENDKNSRKFVIYPIKSVYYVDMSVRIVEHGFAPSLMSPGGSKLRGPTVSYFPPALKTFFSFEDTLPPPQFSRSFLRNTLSLSRRRAQECLAWTTVAAFFVILFVFDSTVNPLIPATTAPSSSATSLL